MLAKGDDFGINNPVFLGGFTDFFTNDLVIGTMTLLALWVNAGASAIEFPGTKPQVSLVHLCFVPQIWFPVVWPPQIFEGAVGGLNSPGGNHSTNV